MNSIVTGDGKEPWYSGPHYYGSTLTWDSDKQHK